LPPTVTTQRTRRALTSRPLSFYGAPATRKQYEIWVALVDWHVTLNSPVATGAPPPLANWEDASVAPSCALV